MTVTVKKLGGSIAAVIPKALAEELSLVAGASSDVRADGGNLVMSKRRQRKRRPLSEIVAKIKPAHYRRHKDLLEDPPVGREVW